MSHFQNKLKRRQGRFKRKNTRSNSRNKRVEHTISLSKSKRDERLMKRRNIGKVLQSSNLNPQNNQDITDHIPTIEELPELVKGVNSNDLTTIKKSTQLIRKMLSVEDDPPVNKVLQTNLISTFVSFLEGNDQFLQFESAWILSNICSGEHEECEYVVDLGVIPIFNKLLKSEDPNILEQSCWALSNISGDCIEYRDLILEQKGVIDNLINIIKSPSSNLDIIQNTNWCLSNLCRGKPRPKFTKVCKAIPIFAHLINQNHQQLVIDACWGLSYLSDGNDLNINSVINAGVVPKMVEFLGSNNPKIQTPALRVIGNIVTGDFEQTQRVMETDILDKLYTLISHQRNQIKKEACWVLSNITAGTENQIQQVIDSDILKQLIIVMQTSNRLVRQEAVWVLSNAIYGGSNEQIIYCAQQGCLDEFIYFLDSHGSRTLKICLEAIAKILQIGEVQAERNSEQNLVIQMIETLGGVEKIEKLTNHKSKVIYKLAENIYETYFFEEESDEDDEEDSEFENYNDYDQQEIDNTSTQYDF
ncbi:importin subunit alpha-4 [Anaeramoeba flamelloides]|uniref:Importin subunit alpha n=1 Tax=Anaeramoeba flamelloides TaxID=1746091 RepID=A0ABQ8XT22_9EUKA|nr:importin subunit alpha-4 [Anaeramoeba flamelloides]